MIPIQNPRNPQKIALFGLGNAGKSSIVKTILYEFEAFSSLLPTTGVDRTKIDFFGREMLIWDFGGQELYRETYLSRPMMYFQGIKYLYYVIDAQDLEKIDESIDYFLKLFDFTMEYSDDVRVYLFFHKIDPDYTGEVNFPEVEERFISAVLPKIKENHIDPVVFHTSIFKPMTVISAFSQPLLGNQTIYETLCEAIDSFCWERELPFGFIIVENLEIGSYYSSEGVFRYVNKRITRYLDHLDDADEIPLYKIEKFDIHTREFEIEMGENSFTFYFAIGVDPLNAPEDIEDIFTSMDEFTDALQNILRNSEIIRTGELRTDDIIDSLSLEERRLRLESLQELEELDDEDLALEMERQRELEILDGQYQKMRENSEEDDLEDEIFEDVVEPVEDDFDSDYSKRSERDSNSQDEDEFEEDEFEEDDPEK